MCRHAPSDERSCRATIHASSGLCQASTFSSLGHQLLLSSECTTPGSSFHYRLHASARTAPRGASQDGDGTRGTIFTHRGLHSRELLHAINVLTARTSEYRGRKNDNTEDNSTAPMHEMHG